MTHASSPSASLSSPTPREVDRDSRTAAAGPLPVRRQPSFTERRLDYLLDEARGFLEADE